MASQTYPYPPSKHRKSKHRKWLEALEADVRRVWNFLCIKGKILWNDVNPKHGLKTIVISKKTGDIIEVKGRSWL